MGEARCLDNLHVEEEVKLRIQHNTFLDLLKRNGIGYSVIGSYLQRDLIFDFPDMRLLKSDQLLRVRLENNEIILTFKGKREFVGHSKKRIEIEGTIGSESALRALERIGIRVPSLPNDLSGIIRLLARKGLKVILEIVKKRTSLKLNGWNCRVHLDFVESLGEFVEIEGSDGNELVDVLQLSRRVVRKSYAEMLAGFLIEEL
ncbi:MAG: hypothetical protein DRO05_03865 [Thermoproteota archaeon]|nr:MAG: hypothetical protein DRO05_03865 [Candidatus Korarchaeota archaeon]